MEKKPLLKNKYFCTVVIILAISITGLVVSIKLLFFGQDGGGTGQPDKQCSPDLPESIETVILNDYSDDHPWWSDEYSYFKQISIENLNKSISLSKECLITLEFNHSLFVDDKRSRADGGDLRLLYFENDAYTEVQIRILEPNTSKTKVLFLPQTDIESKSKDDNYFLYYGNASAAQVNPLDLDGKLYAQNIKAYINRIVYPQIAGEVSRHWILKDTKEFPEFSQLTYTLKIDESIAPDSYPTYELLGSGITGELEFMGKGWYSKEIAVSDLPIGSYQIQATVISSGEEYKSPKTHVFISEPLYITWTMDWEGTDVPDDELARLEEFSIQHNVPITHMFNPRIYVTSEVSEERTRDLTKWVTQRQMSGDEIGMHLHMHYDLVQSAGITPRQTPKWTNYLNNGHDVPMTAYTVEELTQIISWSKDEFLNQGLPSPVSFRAGGWFADLKVLQALENNGFLIDTSGRDSYVWGANRLKGYWNLSATTHPYYPSKSNQNSSSPPPNFNIMELTNNGADSWFFKSEDLTNRFNANYANAPLNQPQVVTYLSHPHQIHTDLEVLTPTFNYIDQHLVTLDQGPVLYVTLQEAYKDLK
ncbi:hypothetical protein JW766_06790 [Candidatus Dojkabacteria bacterium]|nr:hypothetical protein [Candidatus Dojkabacteria bacterium]